MSDIFRLSRRQVLAGGAALAAATAIYPRISVSADGKVLRLRSYSDIQVLDPAFQKAAPEGDIIRSVLVGLVGNKTGDTWGWELDGASKIEQLDDKTIGFTLREGLKWSDGFGEVTAEDVKYSYERIADPAMDSPYKGDWEALDHVEVKNKLSGIIHLKQAFVPLWTTTMPFTAGRIVCKAATEAVGGRFETKMPAQCGRYTMTEWTPKQRTVLKRNPNWPGEPGGFEEIHILPVEDEKTAELGFEGGEIDFTWISVSSIPRYKKTPPKDGSLVVRPSLAYVWLGINFETPPLNDVKVRRAVQHAVDVQQVLDAAYFGVAAPATGIIAPGLVGHREKNLYGHDPDKARALLKEAGFPNGFDCTLDILNKTERVSAAQAIQASLAEIGINVTIQQHDSGTFWSLGDESSGDAWKKIQLMLNRFSMQPDPSWATEWFTPDQVGVWNWERFRSDEFGTLHAEAKSVLDEKKRHEMYVRMQNIMEESGCYVFLTHEAVGVMTRNSVTAGVMPNGTPIFHKFKPA